MNKNRLFLRVISSSILLGFCASCTTTYDSYGRATQSVDPGLAVVGVAAAGLIGYAIGRDNDHHYSSGHRVSYHQSYSHSYPAHNCYVPAPCYHGY